MPGHDHGDSIKNPKVYEALRRDGYSKSSAAAISNAQRGGAARSAGRAAGASVRHVTRGGASGRRHR